MPCRIVAMRMAKKAEKGKPIQGQLFDKDRYTYRIFCTKIITKTTNYEN
jgi:hypothetical protein